MFSDFLIVHKKILPEYVNRVLEARALLDSHQCRSVSDAVQKVGISRSTYYKYKDCVFEPSKDVGWKFTLALYMTDTQGILSKVLDKLKDHNTSIITIHQDIPINGVAHVMITLNGMDMTVSVDTLIFKLKAIEGIQDVSLVAMG